MSNVAAVDAYTGPGRRVTLIVGDVTEVKFRLTQKVVEVTRSDGSTGQYDLAKVSTINATSDGTDFTLAVTSRSEEEDGRSKETGTTARN